MSKISIFWFRRDLRTTDNCGLYHALNGNNPVQPIFIFDRNILDDLEDKKDARVEFIHQYLSRLNEEFNTTGAALKVYYGKPIEIWKGIVADHDIEAVYANHDYEPYAIERDERVASLLKEAGIQFLTFKDHVIFERDEVVKDDGKPYTVFTPYSRKWKAKLRSGCTHPDDDLSTSKYLQSFPSESLKSNYAKTDHSEFPTLGDIGFMPSGLKFPPTSVSQGLIKNYEKTRNFPGIDGTSRLGIHFRFGTISIREKAKRALGLSGTYVNELIWRDFYSMILNWFPKVVSEPFRKKYEFVKWRNDKEDFEKWCEGKTGYPIVDAGMRELNETGYMHNRVRMITASFLTKHLLIDWRWGEAYFAQKLLDFDLASNSGGWQWAAGCGTDAAPYFRVFNPYTQQQKFDKDFVYIRKWVPEYGTSDYVEPIVDHKFARERCLEVYKSGLAEAELHG